MCTIIENNSAQSEPVIKPCPATLSLFNTIVPKLTITNKPWFLSNSLDLSISTLFWNCLLPYFFGLNFSFVFLSCLYLMRRSHYKAQFHEQEQFELFCMQMLLQIYQFIRNGYHKAFPCANVIALKTF